MTRAMKATVLISTHSLTRRLTRLLGQLTYKLCISTHSLTRRLTTGNHYVATHNTHFNSQPHKEADNNAGLWILRIYHFNSQPHKEADE